MARLAQLLFNRALNESATVMKAVRSARLSRCIAEFSSVPSATNIRFSFFHPSIAICHGPFTPEGPWMPGRMREGSAAKAEAPQKIDDDRRSYVGLGATAEAMGSACQSHRSRSSPVTNVYEVRSACGRPYCDRRTPSTPRWRGHPLMHALLRRPIRPMGEVE